MKMAPRTSAHSGSTSMETVMSEEFLGGMAADNAPAVEPGLLKYISEQAQVNELSSIKALTAVAAHLGVYDNSGSFNKKSEVWKNKLKLDGERIISEYKAKR